MRARSVLHDFLRQRSSFLAGRVSPDEKFTNAGSTSGTGRSVFSFFFSIVSTSWIVLCVQINLSHEDKAKCHYEQRQKKE